jgi:protein SCO1
MRPRNRLVPILAATLAGIALAAAAVLGIAAGRGGGRSGGGRGSSAEGSSTGGSAASSPSPAEFDGALLPGNLPALEFALTDQYGRRVSLADFRGRVAILAFLYSTSKATAPLIAQQIRGALDELESQAAERRRPPGEPRAAGEAHSRSDTPALAVSVDPAADTQEHVRAFLRKAALTGRLEYLTGTPAQLRTVWRSYGVVPAGAGETAYERSAFVLLLGRDGRRRVEIPLEELTPEGLAQDVSRLEATVE